MALSKVESSAVRALMQDSAWDVVHKALLSEIDTILAEEVTGQNEFEALKMLHTNQGKVKGLREFLERLEHAAFE